MIQDRPAMVPPAPGKIAPTVNMAPGQTPPTMNMSARQMDAAGAADRSRIGFDNMAHSVLGPQEAQRLSGLRQKVLQRNSDYGWTDAA